MGVFFVGIDRLSYFWVLEDVEVFWGLLFFVGVGV